MLIQPQAGYADNLDNHVRDSLITMKKTYRQSFSKGLLEITFRDLWLWRLRFRRPQYGESKMRRYCCDIYIKSCSVIVKEHVNALGRVWMTNRILLQMLNESIKQETFLFKGEVYPKMRVDKSWQNWNESQWGSKQHWTLLIALYGKQIIWDIFFKFCVPQKQVA